MTEPGPGNLIIRPADQPGDLGWVVLAHGEIYAREYAYDTSFEALVAKIVADYAYGHDPAREGAWIAETDRRRIGSVFCVSIDDVTAQLRILLVDPAGRGHGAGTALVRTCMDFARQAGYTRMLLWTQEDLVQARRVYLAHGFRLTGEEPHHSFGHDLLGQTYEADLTAQPTR
jgi:GNAT superfamily N-acetyltransferase